MAKINSDLISRLQSKLNIGQAAVYIRIQQVARETMLERHLAALVLATRTRINIHKYSTEAERELIRTSLGAGTRSRAPAPQPDVPTPLKSVRKQTNRARKVPSDNSVFVVHGRNDVLRKAMFDFLRALGLKPLEWSHAVATAKGANPYVGDILDSAMERVRAVIVLMSPDDRAQLKEEFCTRSERSTEGKLQGQARPNVLFEAGLALGRHPDKTLLVQVGKIKSFSDIAGKHIVRLDNSFSKRNEMANRLQRIGCDVDRTGNDWTAAGDFLA